MISLSNRVTRSLAAAVVTGAALGGCASGPCRACAGKRRAESKPGCGACGARRY